MELRNRDDARRFVAQGVWLQGATRPQPENVRDALRWSLISAADGLPLLPPGVIADLGYVAFGTAAGSRRVNPVPGWPAALARGYEDYVLGRVYADATFERAADALRTYPAADRVRGLVFVVERIRDRLGIPGVHFPPAWLREWAAEDPDALLAEGFDSLTRDGAMPLLVEQYERLIAAVRRSAELLGPEDVTAVEHRTAVAELGQYVAHRQILLAARWIADRLPTRPLEPLAGRKEVPTHVTDEDVYPVGGYASVANKGTVESLLHSQLAYMEPVERPDLFDVKFVRDELLYYSRDENEFLRRRRAFAFAFDPGLTAARFKDPDLTHQRIVWVQAAVVAVVKALTSWLASDSLRFELLFPMTDGAHPLAHEAELFAVLFREPVARGEVVLRTPATSDAALRAISDLGHASQTHAIWITAERRAVAAEPASVCQWVVDGPEPTFVDGHGEVVGCEADTPDAAWAEAARTLLRLWV